MNFRTLPPFALPLLMLGVPMLGSFASVVRGMLIGKSALFEMAFTLVFLLPVVGLALTVSMFGFSITPDYFGWLFVLSLALPFVGYGLGLIWGERRGKIAAPPTPTHPNG